MRIVFLGKNHHVFSRACLRALITDGSCSLLVGIEMPQRAGLLRTLAAAYRSKGLRFVLARSLDRCHGKVRTAAKRLGVQASGYGSLRELAEEFGIEWFTFAGEALERIRAAAPDLIVVAAFGQILKAPLLSVPRMGAINLHASLLPKYRGPNPLYWVLKNKESQTGVTVHYMDEGIDTGDIILQRTMQISPGDTELSLLKASSEVAAGMVVEAVRSISDGSAERIPQDTESASYYTSPPRGASFL